MTSKEWNVKELIEALKQFPSDAKVYYEMGSSAPRTIARVIRQAPGQDALWQCYWTDKVVRKHRCIRIRCVNGLASLNSGSFLPSENSGLNKG